MTKKPGWTIDVKSLSNVKLAELSLELDGTEHVDIVDALRRELIERLKAHGQSTEDIVRHITRNVPRGRKLNELGRAWIRVLGISLTEFKRIADAK